MGSAGGVTALCLLADCRVRKRTGTTGGARNINRDQLPKAIELPDLQNDFPEILSLQEQSVGLRRALHRQHVADHGMQMPL